MKTTYFVVIVNGRSYLGAKYPVLNPVLNLFSLSACETQCNFIDYDFFLKSIIIITPCMADLMIEKFETKKVLFFMFAKTVVC